MIVEDELLVAMMVEDTLIDHGCEIAGPFARLAEALPAATTMVLDGAVLDVNVNGEKIYAVAEVLASRGVPFVFVSGYGQGAVPSDRPGWVACTKPFLPEELIRLLLRQINSAAVG